MTLISEGRAMREFYREWDKRLERAAGRTVQQVSVRMGDFDARNTHGSMYSVRCVRCGLSGEISIPENTAQRTKCPRCAHVPESEWQSRGQAGLLPPEKPKKPLVIVTVDAEEEEIERHEDDPVELSLAPKIITAGDDPPDDVDEDGMTVQGETENSEEADDEVDGE